MNSQHDDFKDSIEEEEYVQIEIPNGKNGSMENVARELLNSLDDIHEEVDRIMENCNTALEQNIDESSIESSEEKQLQQSKTQNKVANFDEDKEFLRESFPNDFMAIINWNYLFEKSLDSSATQQFIELIEYSYLDTLDRENYFLLVNKINYLLHMGEMNNVEVVAICEDLKTALIAHKMENTNFDFSVLFSTLDNMTTSFSIKVLDSFLNTMNNAAEEVESFFDSLLQL